MADDELRDDELDPELEDDADDDETLIHGKKKPKSKDDGLVSLEDLADEEEEEDIDDFSDIPPEDRW